MSQAPVGPPHHNDQPNIPVAAPLPPSNLTNVQKFEWSYKEAYARVDAGITLITENKHAQANPILQEGLSLLDQAIDVSVASLGVDDDLARHYTEMQNKMRRTRKEVLEHFATSQLFSGAVSQAGYPAVPQNPPSYQDAIDEVRYPQLPGEETTPRITLPTTPTAPCQFSLEVGNHNTPGVSPLVTPIMSPQEGTLLFKIDEGVQIFFIYPDGRVTSPSYPSFLEIVTLHQPLCVGSEGSMAGGFLQVGEWSYPLVKATSPVLHSSYGAYMFPDFSNPVPGSHVGIIIPDSVTADERELFEGILHQMTSYHEQTQHKTGEAGAAAQAASTPSTSERIAAGLVAAPKCEQQDSCDAEEQDSCDAEQQDSCDAEQQDSCDAEEQDSCDGNYDAVMDEGAERVSSSLVWGANKMSELLAQGSERLQQSSPGVGTEPGAAPTKIDPKLQTTAKAARVVSGKAVQVSSYILGQVGKASVGLGRRLAPHVQHHGTRVYTSLTGQSTEHSSAQVDGALDVAAGALKGASTVYMGLEEAAKTLVTSLADNTVKVVKHKYGAEAGEFTDNAMYAVGQSAMAGHNIASLGVKGVAKKAAKSTGKALVESHYEKKTGKEQQQLCGAQEEVMEGTELGEEAREDQGFVLVEKAQEAKERP
ncbi:spartin isoform X1 [Hyalella azteca]|uniref:Spartin isoform X1 n=1 Tax=Hyalella azteca TaxID=294128 RepID=A0A979FMF5_HYAAZ|nr:spartin isoform X1 [Hyalella azteca]